MNIFVFLPFSASIFTESYHYFWFSLWGAGQFIKTKPIHNSEGSIRYVTKYITKSDITPVVWIVKNKYVYPEKIEIEKLLQERSTNKELESL